LERRLMVVVAHPDDETFACGGTMALHASRGVPVTCVIATLGEMGRRMGKPPGANRETLRILREQELREACRALGAADLRLLGIWDKMIEFVDPEDLAARVRAIVEETEPSGLITFHPDYGYHPDHCAIGAAAVRAVEQLPREKRPRLLLIKHGAGKVELPLPVAVFDPTPVLAAKIAAIRAHWSQSATMPDIEERARTNPEQFWVVEPGRAVVR
jgi:N-acetylglucosamine malate deacetylase 2